MEPASDRGFTAILGKVAALAASRATASAPRFIVFVLLITAGLGYFAATHLDVDTHTDRLLDPHLSWRLEEKAFNDAFPQNNHTLAIVVSGATPELVDDAAKKLVAALAKSPDEFKDVNDPAGSDFLAHNGLLFLDLPELRKTSAQLIGAQGLLGTLITDPSLNGLFTAFNLALEGVKRGDIAADSIDKPLGAIADTLEQSAKGKPGAMSWRKMLTGLDPAPLELYRVITTRPTLDYNSLMPGEKPSGDIRRMAQDLGLTPANGIQVRLTGDVALDDEEFSSIEKGIGFATVLSFWIVLIILYLVSHALRAIFAIVATLLVGLVCTFGFAALTVGTLNLISIAFVVMFIGIAVDFSIQFCVRYRDVSRTLGEPAEAVRNTGRSIGGALFLAAVTTAVGFLAFLPTNYKGISELGIIAGAGMLIAFILNVTLLPALLKLVDWHPHNRPNRLFNSARPDHWIHRNAGRIVLAAGAIAVLGASMLPFLRFDFDPLNLKDPKSESIETLRDLTKAGAGGTNVMDVLTRDRPGAPALVGRLEALPEVEQVMWIGTFIPKDQPEKLKIIKDAAQLLLPAFDLAGTAAPASDQKTVATIKQTASGLHALAAKPGATNFTRLADLLDRLTAGTKPDLEPLKKSLLGGLEGTLDQVALLLQPTGITEESIPPSFKADWVSKQGQYRMEIAPKDKIGNSRALAQFITAVRTVAPDAVGPAYFIQQAGHVVWKAFKQAFIYALVGVIIILFIALGHLLDVALVVVPLLFSALMTLATTVVVGLPVNFANVIALPLLMGIGVAFNIYFVANWRAGEASPLRSSTARGVVLSAMTTLTAVGSLALSPHAGTASLGLLLTLCLGYTLLTALVLLPALLSLMRRAR
jgi:hopanoid biosynthesis associated RND transporter like protein HpnN